MTYLNNYIRLLVAYIPIFIIVQEGLAFLGGGGNQYDFKLFYGILCLFCRTGFYQVQNVPGSTSLLTLEQYCY